MAGHDALRPAFGLYFDRLEEAWGAGRRPDLAEFLPDDPDVCRELLPELAELDLDLSWKTEAPRRVEEYLRRFPELLGDARVAVRLIRLEIDRRSHSGPVSLAEYRERFPGIAAELTSSASAFLPNLLAPAGSKPARPARPTAEILRDLNAIVENRPSGGLKPADPVVDEELVEPVRHPPPSKPAGSFRTKLSWIAVAASLIAAFLVGRGLSPKPVMLMEASVGIALSPTMGGKESTQTSGPEQSSESAATKVYSINIRSRMSGYATLVRVDGDNLTVLPKDSEPPIEVRAGENRTYGPLTARRDQMEIGVFVTPRLSATAVVRRVVAEHEGSGSHSADQVFSRVEDALVASGESKIAVGRAHVEVSVRPPQPGNPPSKEAKP